MVIIILCGGGMAFAAGQLDTNPQTLGGQVTATLEQVGVTNVSVGPFSLNPNGAGKAVDELNRSFRGLASEFSRAQEVANWQRAKIDRIHDIVMNPTLRKQLSPEQLYVITDAFSFLRDHLHKSGAGYNPAKRKRLSSWIKSQKWPNHDTPTLKKLNNISWSISSSPGDWIPSIKELNKILKNG